MSKMIYKKLKLIKKEESVNTQTITSDQLAFKDLSPNHAITEKGVGEIIETRVDGEFDGVGFFLNSDYKWVIGEDSAGAVVLIPLKK